MFHNLYMCPDIEDNKSTNRTLNEGFILEEPKNM